MRNFIVLQIHRVRGTDFTSFELGLRKVRKRRESIESQHQENQHTIIRLNQQHIYLLKLMILQLYINNISHVLNLNRRFFSLYNNDNNYINNMFAFIVIITSLYIVLL